MVPESSQQRSGTAGPQSQGSKASTGHSSSQASPGGTAGADGRVDTARSASTDPLVPEHKFHSGWPPKSSSDTLVVFVLLAVVFFVVYEFFDMVLAHIGDPWDAMLFYSVSKMISAQAVNVLMLLLWHTYSYESPRVHRFWQCRTWFSKFLMPGGFISRPGAMTLGVMLFMSTALIKEKSVSASSMMSKFKWEVCTVDSTQENVAHGLKNLQRHGTRGCYSGSIRIDTFDVLNDTTWPKNLKNPWIDIKNQDLGVNKELKCVYACVKWKKLGVGNLFSKAGIVFTGGVIVVKVTDSLSSYLGHHLVTEDTDPETLAKIVKRSYPNTLVKHTVYASPFFCLLQIVGIRMLARAIAPYTDKDGFYTADYYVTEAILFASFAAVLQRIWSPFYCCPMIFTKKMWQEGEDKFLDVPKKRVQQLSTLVDMQYKKIDLYEWIHMPHRKRVAFLLHYARRIGNSQLDACDKVHAQRVKKQLEEQLDQEQSATSAGPVVCSFESAYQTEALLNKSKSKVSKEAKAARNGICDRISKVFCCAKEESSDDEYDEEHRVMCVSDVRVKVLQTHPMSTAYAQYAEERHKERERQREQRKAAINRVTRTLVKRAATAPDGLGVNEEARDKRPTGGFLKAVLQLKEGEAGEMFKVASEAEAQRSTSKDALTLGVAGSRAFQSTLNEKSDREDAVQKDRIVFAQCETMIDIWRGDEGVIQRRSRGSKDTVIVKWFHEQRDRDYNIPAKDRTQLSPTETEVEIKYLIEASPDWHATREELQVQRLLHNVEAENPGKSKSAWTTLREKLAQEEEGDIELGPLKHGRRRRPSLAAAMERVFHHHAGDGSPTRGPRRDSHGNLVGADRTKAAPVRDSAPASSSADGSAAQDAREQHDAVIGVEDEPTMTTPVVMAYENSCGSVSMPASAAGSFRNQAKKASASQQQPSADHKAES